MATNGPCLFLPRSSLGTSDTSSLILLKIISKTARGVQSTHQEAFNCEKTRSARQRSVRCRRRRCVSPGYMLLSFCRCVRTMYPRSCELISFRFKQVQVLWADERVVKKKNARVSLKSCWNPADSALQGHEKTGARSHPLSPWLYRKAAGNTAPANSGNRSPSPFSDATAREPMWCRGCVAWQEGALVMMVVAAMVSDQY